MDLEKMKKRSKDLLCPTIKFEAIQDSFDTLIDDLTTPTDSGFDDLIKTILEKK